MALALHVYNDEGGAGDRMAGAALEYIKLILRLVSKRAGWPPGVDLLARSLFSQTALV